MGLQVGAKLAKKRKKSLRGIFFSLLNLDVFKNGVLEGAGLDSGGPGPRFWRVWGSFCKVLAIINGTATNAKKRQLRDSPVLIPGTPGGQKCYNI